MYERVINLIGIDNFNKLSKVKILLVGIGGVGGFTYEALIRTGFKNITIIDKDKVDITNLNRQLIANNETIGIPKVEVAKYRAKKINEEIKINALKMNLDKDNFNDLDKDFDYIIDACDNVDAKLALIKMATDNNIKLISAMGLGNRVDASKIIITTLDKTTNDPLARKLRKLVKENHLNSKIKVVCNMSLPNKKGKVDSLITSPGIAGLLIANYIINDIITF